VGSSSAPITPPTERTRVSLSVWVITLDLPDGRPYQWWRYCQNNLQYLLTTQALYVKVRIHSVGCYNTKPPKNSWGMGVLHWVKPRSPWLRRCKRSGWRQMYSNPHTAPSNPASTCLPTSYWLVYIHNMGRFGPASYQIYGDADGAGLWHAG